MGCISTVDLQTKMDVQELLSRFCHYLDHGKALEWSRLFTQEGSMTAGPLGVFHGPAEIAKVPEMVSQMGNGYWRHHLTNVMFERTGNIRELEINAYCLVTDWSNGGALVHSADFRATLRNRCHWQIGKLVMTSVADVCALRHAATLPNGMQHAGILAPALAH